MKHKTLLSVCALISSTLLTASHSASAVDLFGYNPNSPPANPAGFNVTGLSYIASRFTVGGSNLTVDSIKYYSGGNGTVTSSIQIWSAKAGSLDGFSPDTLVAGATASFTATDTATPYSTMIPLNFASPVTLTANTNYYVVVDASGITSTAASGFVAGVAQTSTFTAFGGTNATPQSRLITSSNGGSTWASFSSSTFIPYNIGIAVPEPSTYLLGLIGTGALAGIARIRKPARA